MLGSWISISISDGFGFVDGRDVGTGRWMIRSFGGEDVDSGVAVEFSFNGRSRLRLDEREMIRVPKPGRKLSVIRETEVVRERDMGSELPSLITGTVMPCTITLLMTANQTTSRVAVIICSMPVRFSGDSGSVSASVRNSRVTKR